MKKRSATELRAYEIGIAEAKAKGCIVPACKSKKMDALMGKICKNKDMDTMTCEIKEGLFPLIKAYNAGVAHEITRQTMLELSAQM